MHSRLRVAAAALGVLLLTGTAACAPEPSQPATDAPTRVRGWTPRQGATWHVQYAGTMAATDADVVDLDGADAPTEQLAALQRRGGHAICYFNAGAWEDWRADKNRFPAPVQGSAMEGWKGERWLDTRQRDALLPIMTARIDECAAKGFAGIDPDNVNGYENKTGFPLSKADSAAYVKALADVAHARGLAMGLKNASALLPEVGSSIDFAVNEECIQLKECDAYAGLIGSGKAVFNVEYTGTLASVCAAKPAGFSTILGPKNLDGPTRRC